MFNPYAELLANCASSFGLRIHQVDKIFSQRDGTTRSLGSLFPYDRRCLMLMHNDGPRSSFLALTDGGGMNFRGCLRAFVHHNSYRLLFLVGQLRVWDSFFFHVHQDLLFYFGVELSIYSLGLLLFEQSPRHLDLKLIASSFEHHIDSFVVPSAEGQHLMHQFISHEILHLQFLNESAVLTVAALDFLLNPFHLLTMVVPISWQ